MAKPHKGRLFTKELWATPEHREKMKERDAKVKRMFKEDPWRIKSWGVPQNRKGKKRPGEGKKMAIPLGGPPTSLPINTWIT